MNLLPVFSAWSFAVAGMVCAAGPVIIHLLNRRRFRVVDWAAMQFLREAMQRSRKVIQLRDVLLLLLRTAAVLFFGLALARPHFTSRGEHFDAGQPVHAVLLIDNSLSMGHQTLEGTMLDRARQRAADFIERLPVGSRISVIPLCGSQHGFNTEPYDTKPFAQEALQRIEVVDRTASVRRAINESRRVAAGETTLAMRYVLFTDQQASNWSDAGSLFKEPDLPPLQIVDVAASDLDNTWISELRVPDGVADTETPTVIHAAVTHRGREPRGDVRVALHVNGEEVDAQIATLDASDVTREITFEHTFRDVHPSAASPEYIPVKVTLTPDRLAEDDERHLMVPVVAVLPVLFVDQYGDEENPVENRLGETRHLRQLLAPSSDRENESRQLVQVRHLRIDQLDREALAESRLVVIAGVPSPEDQVELLREYVEQGGQLMIAAGAEFDPAAWNAAAWQDGMGILPLPLSDEPLGTLPEVAGSTLQPFFLSFESMEQSPYFELAGNSEQDLRDLYAEPFFFKAVQVQSNPDVLETLLKATLQQLETEPDKADLSNTDKQSVTTLPARSWLLWSPPDEMTPGGASYRKTRSHQSPEGAETGSGESTRHNELLAADLQPKILARFTSESGPPFLVERQLGRGRVIFASSGMLSSWNTLPKTNAIVMLDRILRDMIQSTLPRRTYAGVDRIAVPLPDDARDLRVVLIRPGKGSVEEPLDTGFLGKDRVGVTIDQPLVRGIYQLRAGGSQPSDPRPNDSPNSTTSDTPAEPAQPPRWQLTLAVNGDVDESDLTRIDRAMFEQHAPGDSMRWLAADEDISLAGSGIRGQDLWWWLALLVLTVLIAELMVLMLFRVEGGGSSVEGGKRRDLRSKPSALEPQPYTLDAQP